VVEELKKTVDQLSAYVPSQEAQVNTLNSNIEDLNTELRARELSLERTTAAKDDFQRKSTQLTKKLQGTCSSPHHLSLFFAFN
jgi:outer membrane murein-binding lipoprotein Lpp